MINVRDFECQYCGRVHEAFVHSDKEFDSCPVCGFAARKIITVGTVHCGNEDATWLKSVTEVVDKEGGAASQEFIKNPTRTNYKRWMKAEGLRPLEPGEKPSKPPSVDEREVQKQVWEKYRERNRMEI